MDNNKVISALCYISLLFAPFLLPLIVYFVVKDHEVKHHAKRAFVSHLVPTVFGFLLGIFGFFSVFAMNTDAMNGLIVVIFGLIALYFLLTIAILIWNIVQAVRVLKA